MISIRADFKEALRMARDLPRRRIAKLAQMAINKTIRQVRAKAASEIARRTGLKRGRVTKEMNTTMAHGTRLFARIQTRGRPVPLIHFAGTRQTAKGVRTRAYGKSKLYDSAFIARMKSGHVGVFTRQRVSGARSGAKVGRLKIRQLTGPSIPKTMSEKAVRGLMDSMALRLFRAEFRRLLAMHSGLKARRVLP